MDVPQDDRYIQLHQLASATGLGSTTKRPRATSRPLPVPHPRRLTGTDVSPFWEGDRGYVYEDESTYSLFSMPKPMRTARTSARAMLECVGWMNISSGFDFERDLVVTGTFCSETTGGVYWNEGDICDGEIERGCGFSGEAERDIRVRCGGWSCSR